jgi:hypothetical protein
MNLSIARNQKFNATVNRFSFRRGLAFGLIIISALLASILLELHGYLLLRKGQTNQTRFGIYLVPGCSLLR